ncbi:hypothetical protein CFC21_096033 [Triticum aestivum]|uniref:RRM domain-containing protein n=4 Tax=Triticum TaxID=4564 RepID=A0A9R0Z2K4_TRITD|nr:uncharacterized protein LOC119332265 [Triticum dicoccoides]XP_044426807.1 uncharacterized protein LOC123151096 [Triticum aestivum]XP_048544194.1 uncharacterized protein LOC125523186 [Triticum urartu]KAF7093631.1 hypothetical protein CFC21_096033 [Triticum aestivum]VAI70200.1 unnamed protein product [Triticum turgidum subsp. durum]
MSLSHRRPHLPPAAPPAGDPYYHLYAPQPLQHPDPRQGVVTLFVAGLPDDVKPREIHNLFSRRPGFDHCLLEYTGRGNQAVAFVSFFTHHAALAAMASLNGSVFDPDNGDCLHIELAKSNSRKRHGGGGEVYRVIDKRVRTEENSDNDNNRDEGDDDVSGNDDGQGGSDGQSDEENDNSSDKNELPTDQSGEPGIKQQKGRSSSNDQPDKIPPCSTLFLSNLGQACTEKELEELLSKQPGFHVLKMRRRGGLPAAFADFTDIESSTAAMENLKGTILSSSDSDGLQIEYARSKMRKS